MTKSHFYWIIWVTFLGHPVYIYQIHCVIRNGRIRYNTNLLAVHDEAFLSHSVGAACFRFDGESHDFWCWKNFLLRLHRTSATIADRDPWVSETKGIAVVWLKYCSSPPVFFSHVSQRSSQGQPSTCQVHCGRPDCRIDTWTFGRFEKQRSRGVPGLCPAATAHARALTNEPRLPPQCVHIPTKGGRTTPLLEI